jgi:hypothetical protein
MVFRGFLDFDEDYLEDSLDFDEDCLEDCLDVFFIFS